MAFFDKILKSHSFTGFIDRVNRFDDARFKYQYREKRRKQNEYVNSKRF